MTFGKDDVCRPFVIPAKAGIQAELLDFSWTRSGICRNDVMNPDFLRSYSVNNQRGNKILDGH